MAAQARLHMTTDDTDHHDDAYDDDDAHDDSAPDSSDDHTATKPHDPALPGPPFVPASLSLSLSSFYFFFLPYSLFVDATMYVVFTVRATSSKKKVRDVFVVAHSLES